MEALGINLGFFLVQLLNFIIVMIVLRAWAYEPIVNLLEKRKQTIARGLEDARVAAEARANAEKDAQKILAAAQQQANARVAEATERAEKAAAEVRAQADRDAAAIRKAAESDAKLERDRVLGELRGQVAALSIAAAQKLIGDSLDDKRQHVLIQEFFSGLKNGKVQVVEDAHISGASAEVTSALPLTPEEQATVKRDVLAKLGAGATVSFKVDPSILGGLRVRVGDRILDGSVAGKLEELRQSVG